MRYAAPIVCRTENEKNGGTTLEIGPKIQEMKTFHK